MWNKLTKEELENNKNEFLGLLDRASELKPEFKEGIERLKDDLLKSDFFIAPAASKEEFHGCYDGGLCLHSLNVYKELVRQVNAHQEFLKSETISEYSMIITALLHDLCKINFYKKQLGGHWDKNEDGTLKLTNGRKTWIDTEEYIVSTKREIGHSAKSIYNIMKYIMLSPQEAEAIYWHMGPFDFSTYSNTNNMSKAYNHNKLALFLQMSDYADTYLEERKDIIEQ